MVSSRWYLGFLEGSWGVLEEGPITRTAPGPLTNSSTKTSRVLVLRAYTGVPIGWRGSSSQAARLSIRSCRLFIAQLVADFCLFSSLSDQRLLRPHGLNPEAKHQNRSDNMWLAACLFSGPYERQSAEANQAASSRE